LDIWILSLGPDNIDPFRFHVELTSIPLRVQLNSTLLIGRKFHNVVVVVVVDDVVDVVVVVVVVVVVFGNLKL